MRYVIVFLALCGMVVSVLAFRVHYTTGVEPCDLNSHWDCGTVNRSSYATVNGLVWHIREARNPGSLPGPAPRNGVPVALLGILGYLAILVFAVARLRWLTFLAALCGLAFAAYLSHIEAHVLEVWCLYCVISQGLIALITLLAFAGLFARRRRA